MTGKGKVSNDLVAVSCAAVLAVYAAGYWRTRDAARRIDTQAQERRAAPERGADSASQPPASEAVAEVQPREAPAELVAPPVTANVAPEPKAAPAEPEKVVAAPLPPSPEPLPETIQSVPAPSIADAAVISAIEAASVAVPAPEAPAIPVAKWEDGTYTGWGTSRHGDIKAQVVISNGRIVESSIVSCETRWPCDVITEIIGQPVKRQSPDVDRVSGATASADAYYFALVQALEHAVPEPSGAAAVPQ